MNVYVWYSADKERPEGKWDRVAELMMINFGQSGHPVFRVRCLEERSKAKEVDNYLHTSVPMVIRLKLFFAQSFLSISSASTEQSQNCVKSTVLCKTSLMSFTKFKLFAAINVLEGVVALLRLELLEIRVD